MAVAFDAVTAEAAGFSGASSYTIDDHTTSGSDRVALCCVGWSVNTAISSITYGGSNMTLPANASGFHAATEQRASIYYYVAPPTAATDCAISWGGAVYGYAAVISANGVDQSTPVSNAANANGATSPSVTVTSAVGELVVDCAKSYSVTVNVGAGQTQRFSGEDGSFDEQAFGSTEDGAASVTMSWSNTPSREFAIAAISLKEATGGGGAANRKRIWRMATVGVH